MKMSQAFAATISCTAILSVLCLAGPPKAPETTRVTATGQAVGVDLGAQDEATADAKRNAVRKGCGELISSSTLVQNFELADDQVFSKAGGYIVEKESKVQCQKDEQNNITTCTIDAVVASAKLDQVLKGIPWKQPRIAVVTTEDLNPASALPPKFSLQWQGVHEKLIQDLGYRVVDQATVQKNLEKLIAAAKLEDNFSERADLMRKLDAEIVAYFHFTCPPCREEKLGGSSDSMFVCDGSLTARAVQLDTATVLYADTLVPEQTLKSSGVVPNSKEVKNFLTKYGGKAVKEMKKHMDELVYNTRSVDCTFVCGEGIGSCVDEFRKVRTEVRRIRGVEDISIRQGLGTMILTEIAYAFPVDRLAQALVESESKEFTYKTLGTGKDTLKIGIARK